MRLKEFTEIDESRGGAFPFKTSHFVKDISSKVLGKNPEKHIARKFKAMQVKWGKDFKPDEAMHYIARVADLSERDVRAWLQHAGLMESDGV